MTLSRITTVLFFFVLVAPFACSQKGTDQNPKEDSKYPSKGAYFELYGNYLPTKDLLAKGYRFQSIEIDTHDSLGASFVKGVFLRFINMKVKDVEYHVVDTKFSGTKDKFLIVARDSILGDVEIKGRFFGTRGPMNDNIQDPKTIVFEGSLSVDGATPIEFECTYFEGD